MQVYSFSGKQGCGKNFVGEQIFNKYINSIDMKNTIVMSFADHFKVDVCTKDKIDYDRVFVKKDNVSRKLLQSRGTEEGRNVYGDDIWIKTLDTWMKLYNSRGVERFIICDLRFKNEAKYIKSLGGKCIRINATNRNLDALKRESNGDMILFNNIKNHISETDLDDYDEFDLVVDNDYGKETEVDIIIKNYVDKIIQNISNTN